MSEKPPFVTEPRCYQVSFDATIPNVHPAALPGERQRVALTRVVTAWDALDASNQVKMECERAYREDKTAPHWKATNGVLPYWEAKFCGSAGPPVAPGSSELERIRAGVKVGKEHAQRHADDYGAKGSVRNEEYWRGCIAGIDTIATIVETVFSMADDHENKPTYRCKKCQKTARELDNGNWLHRINPGETPSVWLCDICINVP